MNPPICPLKHLNFTTLEPKLGSAHLVLLWSMTEAKETPFSPCVMSALDLHCASAVSRRCPVFVCCSDSLRASLKGLCTRQNHFSGEYTRTLFVQQRIRLTSARETICTEVEERIIHEEKIYFATFQFSFLRIQKKVQFWEYYPNIF